METRNFVRSEHSAASSRRSGRSGDDRGSCEPPPPPPPPQQQQLNFSPHKVVVELDEAKAEELKRLGISIEDSDCRNYSNITPQEVFAFYKSIEDWENVLPKTDYTYSPASIYYRKKINGNIPVIPNMSRRPIRSSGSGSGSGSGSSSSNGSFCDFSRDNRINSTLDRTYRRTFSSSQSHRRRQQRATQLFRDGDHHLLSVRRVSRVIRETYWRTTKWWSLVYSEVVWRRRQQQQQQQQQPGQGSRRRTTRAPYFFYFIALLVLLASALYLLFARPPPTGAISHLTEKASGVFVGLFSFLNSLVLNVFELTRSSVGFLLSSVWMLVDTVRDGGSRAATATSTSTAARPRPLQQEEVHLSDLEQMLGKLFDEKLDRNAESMAKRLISTVEFETFIAEKLKSSEVVNAEASAAAAAPAPARDHDLQNTAFARKLNTLEEMITEWRTEQAVTLKESIGALRERITRYEQRIQQEVLVLVGSVAGQTDSVDEARRKFAALFQFVGEASLKIDDLSKQLSDYAKNSSENFHIMERLRVELHNDLAISIDQLISSKLNEWKSKADNSDTTKSTTTAAASAAASATFSHFDQLERYVKMAVKEALEVYDADKTGRPDFALESQGGTILSTRCTETRTANAQFFIFGIPLWHASRSPRTVIQPGVHPGECWAFPGSTGYLVIQLSEKIFVTGFTLEHLPKLLSPNGSIDSAPKDFSVWALRWETDSEPSFLGEFRYHENGTSLQYFQAVPLNEFYQIVELRILSNHGKMEYTCLYRFRVHGKPAAAAAAAAASAT